jgi:hypothetical protein
MTKPMIKTTHIRTCRLIVSKRDLERMMREWAVREAGFYADATKAEILFPYATEGSPPYKVGTECIIDLTEETARLLALKEGMTPGPWFLNGDGEDVWVEDGTDGRRIHQHDTDYDEPWEGQIHSNASAIAAVPDMLTHIEAQSAQIAALRAQVGALARAGNHLSVWAQTTGGTSGRDDGLVDAVDIWGAALREIGGGNEPAKPD